MFGLENVGFKISVPSLLLASSLPSFSPLCYTDQKGLQYLVNGTALLHHNMGQTSNRLPQNLAGGDLSGYRHLIHKHYIKEPLSC